MNTYIAKMQIGAGDIMPIGSTLYGTCDTWPSVVNKRVTLPMFDNLVHGVTVVVKFTRGNTVVSGVQLKVAETLAYPVIGDCTCGENETISFTFEEIDATNKHWLAHVSGLSDNVKNYIDNAINTSTETPDVLIMKGTIGTGGNPGSIPVSGYETGWTYRVITDGTYADWACKAGDIIIAISDAAANQSTVNSSHWIVLQSKLNNAVVGPNYAVDGNIVVFDGTSGELIRDSGVQLPANPQFTDTTYTAGTGLLLNDEVNNQFTVDFETVARADHDHDDEYASINHHHDSDYAEIQHTHGIITYDGKAGTNQTNALLQVTNGSIAIGPTIDDHPELFLNQTGNWANVVLSVNKHTPDPGTGAVTIRANDLGLGAAMHFIGIVDPQRSTFRPSDTHTSPTGSEVLIITGVESYTPEAGDIIIDDDREYIYTIAEGWEQLGANGNFKTIQQSVNSSAGVDNRWVSGIAQDANGAITNVSYTSLITTGTWSGNAGTASALATARELYVDLSTTRSVQSKVLFDGSADKTLHVSGILPITHGGTGVDRFTANQVILSDSTNGTTNLVSRAYSDSQSADAISNSSNFVTERDIYYGLPKINELHDYDSDSPYFAPVTAGTSRYQLLVSGTRTVNNTTIYDPEWTPAATLQSETSTIQNGDAYTTLTLGNSVNKSSETAHSEGKIILYSAAQGGHIINGVSTESDYTHTLLNSTGYILQIPSLAAVGSKTNPVYINQSGTITALEYTPNYLYYSASSSSFEATHLFTTDGTNLGININAWPSGNQDSFYVSGGSYLSGTLLVTGATYIADNSDISTSNNTDTASFVTDGGAIIRAKAHIYGNTQVDGTLYVEGNVGLGCNAPESNSDFTVALGGNTEINGNLIPTTGSGGTADKTLGSTNDYWAALFLSADYGDPYTPVYWNNTSGTPAATTPTQRIPFQFDSQHTQILQYTSDAIKANTEVIAIVVTSGIQLLHSEIEWEITTINSVPVLQLSATTNIGNGQSIIGYVMISKTAELSLTPINSSSGSGNTPTEPNSEP